MDFNGKTVLVTGASGSIGQAIVRQFASAGGRVAVHYHANRQGAEQLIAELGGPGHIAVGANMMDADSIYAMVEQTVKEFGRLDVLVNNAGIFTAHPPLSTSYDEWQSAWAATLAVNLVGAANATFRAVPHLIAAGGGAVVNVTSRGAFRGEPDNPAYGASKAGLNSFAQSMALALAPHGISVTCVAPGFVETEMAREVLDGPGGEAVRAQSPFGRVARPEEVAEAVLWLASPGARFSTGTIVDVNGASYLRS